MKVVALIVGLVMVCSFAVANERVVELQSEGQTLINNKAKLEQQLQQITMRLIQIEGILREYELIKSKDAVKDEG